MAAKGSAPFQLARTGDAPVRLPPASSPLPKEFGVRWQGTVDVRDTTTRIGLRVSAAIGGTTVGLSIFK